MKYRHVDADLPTVEQMTSRLVLAATWLKCATFATCRDTDRCLPSFEVKVFCSFKSLFACLAYSAAQTQACMKSLALYIIVDYRVGRKYDPDA